MARPPNASRAGGSPGDIALPERLRAFIAAHSLLDGVRRLGLAVSGGSDSLSLLHLMAPLCREAGIEPVALNFDHAIPGEHSDADAAFARDEAAQLGIAFHGEVAEGVRQGRGKSLEMAAREARLAFYRRAAARLRLDAIATGHQADDVAETLLLRLLRGAGAAGLSGLRPRSELPPPTGGGCRPLVIVRPLLDIRRGELRDWLRGKGLGWCEDPSNANESIPRNGVRHSVLPALAVRGGGEGEVVRQLVQSAAILREEDAYLEGVASAWLADSVVTDDFPLARARTELPLALRRRAARAWLLKNTGPEGSGFASVETVLALADGAVATLPGGWRATCANGVLRLAAEVIPVAAPPEAPLPMPGSLNWGDYTLETTLGGELVKERGRLGGWPARCTLSADRIAGRPLSVRGRLPGDRMAPYGLSGTKKLQDIFTDAKVPEAGRNAYPVVVCGGEIVWVPGYRVAAPFAVRDGDRRLQIVVRRQTAQTDNTAGNLVK